MDGLNGSREAAACALAEPADRGIDFIFPPREEPIVRGNVPRRDVQVKRARERPWTTGQYRLRLREP